MRGHGRRPALPVAGILSLAILACIPRAGDAQEVEFTPRADRPVERRLDEFLERADYAVLTSDTVLRVPASPDRSILVLDAAVRLATTVPGDVFVVDGDLFLRPGARVEGDVVVLGGGYYASELAEVSGEVTYLPNELYSVARTDGGWRIFPIREEPKAVDLHGLYGFGFPYYQRVDAVTLRWGATLRATGWAWQPSLEGELRFITEQGEFQGTLKQYWYPSGSFQFGFEAERVTRTNEDWIRGDISNSLSYFFVGDDFRNYYGADRVSIVLRGSETASLQPLLSVEWEEASSKEARKQFVLFGDDEPALNPVVDEGETVSLIAGLGFQQRGADRRFEASVRAEVADSSIAGDFSFVFGEARLYWLTPGFGSHEVELFGIVRGDLSGDLPAQRWSAFGGRATLPTFDLLSFRGPRLVYGQASYLIPISALRVAMIGPPKVLLRAVAGSAWGPDDSEDFESNLIAGLRWSVFEAGVAVDPGGSDPTSRLYAILRFPGDL
ncbi:MAG: hypothetical protein M8841_11255 [marine benthic group bacterium]|nr:hypothetical protein [Gemmatimonadota bacterium]MCL7957135.1 hypothetical protein [Gemmatimonadota bacterium]MCL7967920.1 hypothetical protein [Gemmatimonadota bacterium]MCL7979987.1 hypothetical protein [Gemmatimonadota bacterium]